MELSRLVSEDSRTPAQKMRRAQLWRAADKAGIDYPKDAPKTIMLQIFEAHGVDVTRYQDFYPVAVKDESGGTHTEVYPVIPEHATSGKEIDYDAEIKKRADQAEKDQARIEELEQQNKSFSAIEQRLNQIEKLQLPLEKLLPWQLQHLAKAQGIETKGKTKEDLIELLGG